MVDEDVGRIYDNPHNTAGKHEQVLCLELTE